MIIDDEFFLKVKANLGIVTDDEDINISIRLRLNTIVGYLINGGASETSIISDSGIGCIAIGVNDLLSNEAGGVKFSPDRKSVV